MSPSKSILVILVYGALLGCTAEVPNVSSPATGIDVAVVSVYSEWSTPEPLPAGINTSVSEQNAILSKDGLSLYFTSDRPGGLGGLDIYIAQRASLESPWGNPANLGAPI